MTVDSTPTELRKLPAALVTGLVAGVFAGLIGLWLSGELGSWLKGFTLREPTGRPTPHDTQLWVTALAATCAALIVPTQWQLASRAVARLTPVVLASLAAWSLLTEATAAESALVLLPGSVPLLAIAILAVRERIQEPMRKADGTPGHLRTSAFLGAGLGVVAAALA